MTYHSVYATGATRYNPTKCWNGYTIFQAKEVGALLIDMNGGEVQLWKKLHGMPNRILPGGLPHRQHRESAARPSESGRDRPGPGGLGRQHRVAVQPVRVHRGPGRGAALDGEAAPRLPAGGQPGRVLRAGHGAPGGPGQHDDPVPQEPEEPQDLRQTAARRHHHRGRPGRATSSGNGCAATTSRSWVSARRPGTSCSAIPTGCSPAEGWATGCTSTPCPLLGPEPLVRRGRRTLSPGQHHLVRPGDQHHRHHRQENGQDRLAARAQLRRDPGAAGDGLDHRPAPRPHDPKGPSRARATS